MKSHATSHFIINEICRKYKIKSHTHTFNYISLSGLALHVTLHEHSLGFTKLISRTVVSVTYVNINRSTAVEVGCDMWKLPEEKVSCLF